MRLMSTPSEFGRATISEEIIDNFTPVGISCATSVTVGLTREETRILVSLT